MNRLEQFFQTSDFELALASYAKVLDQRGWGIGHKLDLYNCGKYAFADETMPVDERLRGFRMIYDSLRSGWKVFRNSTNGHWSAEEVFECLNSYGQILSLDRGLTLLNISDADNREILTALSKLRDIKRTNQYPWMPVAKFTHFFNPRLCPIYDIEVVWKQVLNGVFKNEYQQWCRTKSLEWNEYSERFNLNYIRFASDLMQKADANLMPYFATWFKAQTAGHKDVNNVLTDIDQYYATAFEFILLGAAALHS